MRLGEKIGYGLGDTASSMLWKLFSVYLMFFYTDISGIDAWVVGVLFLVTRIWDSLLDPVVGLLCDRTHSRWGTFRPWLLWGALPFGVLGILTFYMPEWSSGGKVVYATVTYSLMMIVYSSVNVPYAALLGVMSADPHERTVLAAVRRAFAAAGSMVVVLAVEALVKAFRPWAGSSGSWTAAVAVVAVVAVLLFFVTFATTRERIRPVRTERATLRAVSMFFVKTAPPRPYSLAFARSITSSRVLNFWMTTTGPKISSWQTRQSLVWLMRMVGFMKKPLSQPFSV